jgi:hypothetical protein
MTRRLFATALSGAASALASAREFAVHSVLRRPYRVIEVIPEQDCMLIDCLFVRAKCSAPLRFKATAPGEEEPVLALTAVPRSDERVMLLGLHGFIASRPLTVQIDSSRPFELEEFSARYMHPGFRRVDGMIVYNNPIFLTHQDWPGFAINVPWHHRKMFGPGKDVGYV